MLPIVDICPEDFNEMYLFGPGFRAGWFISSTVLSSQHYTSLGGGSQSLSVPPCYFFPLGSRLESIGSTVHFLSLYITVMIFNLYLLQRSYSNPLEGKHTICYSLDMECLLKKAYVLMTMSPVCGSIH
jgi:hypothetical protein